jgi:hypothetical protein
MKSTWNGAREAREARQSEKTNEARKIRGALKGGWA